MNIANPIIQRELVGMLRTRRAMAAQVLLVAILGMLVVLRWPTEARSDYSGHQAQQVLQLFGYGMLVGLILLAPVFPASSIVREKQQGTLALLLNSPMHPWSIYIGKFLGVTGFVLLLLILSLPAAAACYVMGGITTTQLVKVYLILGLVALQYAALGLMVSSYASTTDAALRLTYGTILLLCIVTLGPYQFFQGLATGTAAQAIVWIRAVSPISAMMEVLGHGGYGSQGVALQADLTVRFVTISVALTVAFAAWTAARFNRKMFDKSRAQGRITDEQQLSVRVFRRIMFLWFFDPQRRTGLIGNWTNPVRVKEFRTRKFGRAHWILRLFGACLVLSLGLILLTTVSSLSWDVQTLGAIIVLLQMSLIVLATPSLASGVISGEIESGGWELLQMTPLSAFAIVTGKLASAAWTMVLMLLATMPAYATLIFIQKEQARQISVTLVCLGLTAVMALLLTAAISSLFRRTAAATVASYIVLITLCAGTMLAWVGQDAPFTHETVQTVLMFNPLAAALSLIEAPGFVSYTLVPFNWYITGAIAAASLALLVWRTWRLTRPQ
ncbi:MAG: ABC transporter permease [Phycisphaeraceae bacterium]|nr:ABC transporter permease [Phycisphaeraceae bacterium]